MVTLHCHRQCPAQHRYNPVVGGAFHGRSLVVLCFLCGWEFCISARTAAGFFFFAMQCPSPVNVSS